MSDSNKKYQAILSKLQIKNSIKNDYINKGFHFIKRTIFAKGYNPYPIPNPIINKKFAIVVIRQTSVFGEKICIINRPGQRISSARTCKGKLFRLAVWIPDKSRFCRRKYFNTRVERRAVYWPIRIIGFPGGAGIEIVLPVRIIITCKKRPAKMPGFTSLVDLIVASGAARLQAVVTCIRPHVPPIEIVGFRIYGYPVRIPGSLYINFRPGFWSAFRVKVSIGYAVASIFIDSDA